MKFVQLKLLDGRDLWIAPDCVESVMEIAETQCTVDLRHASFQVQENAKAVVALIEEAKRSSDEN